MKLINDTWCYEPHECYFASFIGAEDRTVVLITPIESWKEEGCLSDSIGDQSFEDGVIPPDINCIMEACWDTDLSVKQAKLTMIAAGFVFSQEMNDELKDSY